MKSLQRRIKRGHSKIEISETVKNIDGSKKLIVYNKTKRGLWVQQ